MDQQIEAGSVVVAADGSGHADRAVRWAAQQARLEGRPLAVVMVAEDALVLRRAVELARDCEPDLTVSGVSMDGDPRHVLLGLSARAGLLVLGSRGRGAVRSMLLGSVSGAVSAHAACPVVVCRPPTGARQHRGVVVGADGTPESLPVIEFGYRIAAQRGLPLTVLHCFWDVVAAVADYRQSRGEHVEAPELEELRALLAESVGGFAEAYPEVEVRLELRHGLVDEALSPRGEAWDLIVVGRHPFTSTRRLLTGSIATAVIERSQGTVAVVPEAAGSA